MRGGLYLLAAAALSAQAPDPTQVLAKTRDRIVGSRPSLPNYTCTQTVDRGYYRRPKQPVPPPSCAELRKERDAHDYLIDLFLTDRLRLDVKVSRGVEIGSWPGASQFDEKSIFDLVGRGPFSTGALGTFLSDIFDNTGASFSYRGIALSDAGELYLYGYQIPRAASHYVVKTGKDWEPVAYEGEVSIDPHSLDLKHLVVRANDLPAEADACQVTTSADYAMVRLSKGSFLLPLHSRVHIVTTTSNEDDITTVYTGCREYQSESKISFGDGATASALTTEAPAQATLPAGLPISLELAEQIDSDHAAVGDVVLEKVRKAVRAKHSKQILIPAGATVRGRIVKMQHWTLSPERFDIAIRLESWEAGGVTSPLSVEPDTNAMITGSARRAHGEAIELPPNSLQKGVRKYLLPANPGDAVLPRGTESAWVTVSARSKP